MTFLTCEWCRKQFPKKPSGRNAFRFCSRQCSGRNRTARSLQRLEAERAKRVCVSCGVPVLRQLTRCPSCQEARRAAVREQASLATTARVCRICGQAFTRPLHRPGTFRICPSTVCRQTSRKERLRQQRQKHGKKAGSRARKKGLAVERCGPMAVCARDGWRCRLCGASTPRRLRGTYHPQAPEVDHIIPLSHPESPGHVWANVQCLCRACNARKGATVQGQLRLAV